jgi:hypothetical protein
MDNDKVIAIVAVFVLVIAVAMALRSLFMKKTRELAQDVHMANALEAFGEQVPRCLCGEPATEPMPVLRRDRGTFDFLRKLFAAPPRYVRYVDKNAAPALCAVHAHVADAKMDEFIFQRVRAVFAVANATVAIEAAGFERESLAKHLEGSLTDRERKSLRKTTNNVISLAVNGDARESSG